MFTMKILSFTVLCGVFYTVIAKLEVKNYYVNVDKLDIDLQAEESGKEFSDLIEKLPNISKDAVTVDKNMKNNEIKLSFRSIAENADDTAVAESDSSEVIEKHPAWQYIDNEEEGCGESNADRIVGGIDAALGQFPWMARLGYASKRGISFRCGGVLINPVYVLTAAHCVTGDGENLAMVRLGEYNTKTKIDCVLDMCAEPYQDIKPMKKIVHSMYNKPKFANDIAMIRLKYKVKYNGWVSPICLPHSVETNPAPGSSLETAGWGYMDMKTMNTAIVLQTIKLPVVSKDDCAQHFKEIMNITEKQLCAGGILNEDACGGDSGGPIMKVDISNGYPQYFLVGIVSFGPSLCGNKVPGVYTSVPQYLKWILDHIEPTN